MVVFLALFGAPGANIHAQLAIFFCITIISRHHFYRCQACINANNATQGAIIMTFFPGHLDKAVLASHHTVLASLYTIFEGGSHNLVFA